MSIDSSTPMNDDETAIETVSISEGDTVSGACIDGSKYIVKYIYK